MASSRRPSDVQQFMAVLSTVERTCPVYREVRQRFKDATPLGFSHAGTVEANPTEDAVLKEGDWIFGIASDKRAFSMSQVCLS